MRLLVFDDARICMPAVQAAGVLLISLAWMLSFGAAYTQALAPGSGVSLHPIGWIVLFLGQLCADVVALTLDSSLMSKLACAGCTAPRAVHKWQALQRTLLNTHAVSNFIGLAAAANPIALPSPAALSLADALTMYVCLCIPFLITPAYSLLALTRMSFIVGCVRRRRPPPVVIVPACEPRPSLWRA